MNIGPRLYDCGISETLSYIATEYFPRGDLRKFINNVFFLNQSPSPSGIHLIANKFINSGGEVQKSIFKGIYDLVKVIHSLKIYHLDIKPDNIVIDNNMRLKLIDFGFGQDLNRPGYDHSGRLFSTCGTAGFCAPEILKLKEETKGEKKGYIPGSADVFALGITLFALNAGFLPFANTNSTDEMYCLIQKEQYELFWELIEIKLANSKIPKFSAELKKLIIGMILELPEERLTMGEVINHPWMKDPSISAEFHIREFMEAS